MGRGSRFRELSVFSPLLVIGLGVLIISFETISLFGENKLLSLLFSAGLSLFIVATTHVAMKLVAKRNFKRSEDGSSLLDDTVRSFAEKHAVCVRLVKGDSLDVYTLPSSEKGCRYLVFISEKVPKLFTKEEVNAIIMHEIGHVANRDFLRSYVISFISLLLTFAGTEAILLTERGAVGVLVSLAFILIISALDKKLRRKKEFRADEFSAKNYSPKHIANALSKFKLITGENGGQERGLIALLFDTHPRTNERIERIRKKFNTDKDIVVKIRIKNRLEGLTNLED